MAAALKGLKFTIVAAAVLWLGTRLLDSYSLGNFAYRLGVDVGTCVNYGVLFLVPITLIGVPWLIYTTVRNRRH